MVERFLSIVDDPERYSVFLHCCRGRHRAGVVVALYRVLCQGWSADEALDEMQAYHFSGGRLHLKDYLHRCPTATAGTRAAGEPPATGSGDCRRLPHFVPTAARFLDAGAPVSRAGWGG